MEKADPTIQVWIPGEHTLNPDLFFNGVMGLDGVQVVWLNHHDALHSRWQEWHVRALQERGIKVLVTYHDTREQLEPGSKLAALAFAADHLIVHEPVVGLTNTDTFSRVSYIRQGVPELPGRIQLDWRELGGWCRPVLGTVGFDFPWKNYNRLAQLTEEIGWGFMLVCPNLTQTRTEELESLNRHFIPVTPIQQGGMVGNQTVLTHLGACTATAFMYECSNTGTSGAIRLGIAARKPVFAHKGCRQFRDLWESEEESASGRLINWVEGWHRLRELLIHSWPVESDPAMVYLAERDSMAKVGERYATILNLLVLR